MVSAIGPGGWHLALPHVDEALSLRLEVAEDHGFTFDAVQMPLNVMDAHSEFRGAAGAGDTQDRACWA